MDIKHMTDEYQLNHLSTQAPSTPTNTINTFTYVNDVYLNAFQI